MTSRARAFSRRTCSPTRPIAPATSSACRGSSRSDADDPRAHGRLSTRGDDAERGDRRLPVADREARRQGRRLPHGDGGPRARGGTRRGRAISSGPPAQDRKSTRLNSSHLVISYAVFCLKKKKKNKLIEKSNSKEHALQLQSVTANIRN